MKIYVTGFMLLTVLIWGCNTSKKEEARQLHEQILTVDTHCDTPMDMVREKPFDVTIRNDKGCVDLPRMKEGGLDAMFFAVFTGQKPRTEETYRESYEKAHQMLDSIHAVATRNPSLMEIGLSAADGARIEKTGKRAIFIGMENGFPIGTELNRVQEFYDRGVRYITLCHSRHNDICDSSTDDAAPEHNGLSEFGKEVVAEMNRLGMIIDVSHISDKSFFDVVETSKAPVIASHSSVRAIAGHNRNMTDKMIQKLTENRGVIQICPLSVFIQDPDTTSQYYKARARLRNIFRERGELMTKAEHKKLSKQWGELRTKYKDDLPSVKHLVDHIDHVVKLVGVDHVGIGSDFDGGGGLSDCIDVSEFPNITAELIRRGYSREEICKIWGGNFFRVFEEVERIAEKG